MLVQSWSLIKEVSWCDVVSFA